MNKMKTTVENLLRKSVGLSAKGSECCDALPVKEESGCCTTAAAKEENPPASCCAK